MYTRILVPLDGPLAFDNAVSAASIPVRIARWMPLSRAPFRKVTW